MATTRFLVFVLTLALGGLPAAAADLPPGGSFVDDNGNIHEGNIEAIKAEGITRGCNPPVNDRFCPGDSVTRGQMAAFLVRALDLPDASVDFFGDDDGSVFEANINALAAEGITRGCNPPANDRFCPNNNVRRDEMATFLARALGLSSSPPPPAGAVCVGPPAGSAPVRQIIVTPGASPTLAQALGGAQPGDEIVLAAGTHSQAGNLVITQSGTPANWIRIVAAPGPMPIIDLAGAGEFRISGSYVSLEGVDIRNGGGNNLHIAPDSEDVHHVRVADTVIHDLAWGPGAAVKVNRNNNQAAGVGDICLQDNDVSEAINNAIIDGVGVDGAVVVGNDIHDNATGSHGIFFKGGSVDIVIEANLIRGIRGNAALQLGGNTGASFWNPLFPSWEGVDQVARNNIIADFDDSAVEIRGVDGAQVYNNTIVTQSSFAVFRLQSGNDASGGVSGNDNVDISGNLIISTGGDPQYARNDGGAATITFGPQLWAGPFHNSGASTPGIPTFPLASDVITGSGATVVVVPTTSGLFSIGEAISRYRPVGTSPALGQADVLSDVVADFLGVARSTTAPTLGAIENP